MAEICHIFSYCQQFSWLELEGAVGSGGQAHSRVVLVWSWRHWEWMFVLSITFQQAGGSTGLAQLPAGFPTEAGFQNKVTPLTKVKCLPPGQGHTQVPSKRLPGLFCMVFPGRLLTEITLQLWLTLKEKKIKTNTPLNATKFCLRQTPGRENFVSNHYKYKF